MTNASAPAIDPADITLAELLERHRQALGGEAALLATAVHEEDAEVRGTAPHHQTTLQDQRCMRLRVTATVPTLGLTITIGFDGTLAWEVGPRYDGYYPASHPETRRLAGMLPPLWRTDLPADGPAAPRLLGLTQDGAGRRCYAVERTERNEADQMVPVRELIDAGTWLLSEQLRGADGADVTRFQDYRPVAGRLFPFLVSHRNAMGEFVNVVQGLRIATAGDDAFRHPTHAPPAAGNATVNPDLAAFDTVWSTIGNIHYDPGFGGLDWNDVRERYRPRAAELPGSGGRQFVELVTSMLGELKATHYVVVPRERVQSGEARDRKPGRVGVGLRMVEGCATVYEVRPDSPAGSSPLRPGFVVTAINGKDREALSTAHAAVTTHGPHPEHAALAPYDHEMRVQAGDPVVIAYRDEADRPGEVTLVAEPQELHHNPRFEARRLDDVLLITFKLFMGDVTERTATALAEHRDAAGLVIDLRGNPGGIAQVPAVLTGLLVTERADLGRFLYRSQTTVMETPGTADAYRGPIAVLVDAQSGSCSELFAGALQEMGRARIFGRRSAGAVLPATTLLLPNGCQLQYALCDYKTAQGTRLEGAGVSPDEPIELRRADLLAGRDPDLEAALRWIRK